MYYWSWCLIFSVLIVVVYSIPIDNGVQSDPVIKCSENSIGIKFQTRNAFEGHVFVKGHYAEQGCRSDESNNNEPQILLNFNACGIRRTRSANPRGIFVTAVVIITFHPQFVTKVDRAYAIQCFYMEAEKSVTAELEVSMLTTSLYTQTVPMPICKYEVLDNGPNGSPVKFTRIGDPVYHRWTCDSQASETFCMTVHSCLVDDGTGNKITLLDANGCAQDKYLLGNLEYPTDLSAGRESHVFKYADRPSLFFNCQISITIKEPGSQCTRPQCTEPARGKRFAHHIRKDVTQNSSFFLNAETIDVDTEPITIVDLDPTFDISKANNNPLQKRPNAQDPNNICMSFIGFSSYAAVNLVLIIASIIMFICACKRARKEMRMNSIEPSSLASSISALNAANDPRSFEVGIWLNVLTAPNTPDFLEFFKKIESFIYETFYNKPNSTVKVEWSKGFEYTDEGRFKNTTVLNIGW